MDSRKRNGLYLAKDSFVSLLIVEEAGTVPPRNKTTWLAPFALCWRMLGIVIGSQHGYAEESKFNEAAKAAYDKGFVS